MTTPTMDDDSHRLAAHESLSNSEKRLAGMVRDDPLRDAKPAASRIMQLVGRVCSIPSDKWEFLRDDICAVIIANYKPSQKSRP